MSLSEALLHAVAGTVGGILAYTALYPLEVIRTRLQVQVSLNSDNPYKSEHAHDNITPLYSQQLPFRFPPYLPMIYSRKIN